MKDEGQDKVMQLLDVIAVEVAANRNETAQLRTEMHGGFDRVEHRLGNLEVRVEDIETELRSFHAEFDRRITPLEVK